MSSSDATRESRVMLTTENYALWLLPMKAKLHKMKVLNIVNGAVARPDPETDKPNAQLFDKLNEEAYVELIQHISQEVLALVSTTLPPTDEFNGCALWKLLQSEYAGNDLTARTTALKGFLSLEYTSFKEFVSSVRAANQKMTLSGLVMDDQVKNILMLDKLPKDFLTFKTNVAMHFENEALEKIIKKLEDFASQNHLIEVKRSSSPTQMQSMYTRSSDSEFACPHCKRGFRFCCHCLKIGHSEDNCFKKHPSKQHQKSAGSSSKQSHSTHLTRYTEEDEQTLEYLQQKYPDLHL